MNFFLPAATDSRGDSVNLTIRRMKGLERWEGSIRLAALAAVLVSAELRQNAI